MKILILFLLVFVVGFSILDTAPNSHKFKLTMFQPTDPKYFFKTVRNEIKLLRTSLPQGIWVKGFEDRMVSWMFMLVFFFHKNFKEVAKGQLCTNSLSLEKHHSPSSTNYSHLLTDQSCKENIQQWPCRFAQFPISYARRKGHRIIMEKQHSADQQVVQHFIIVYSVNCCLLYTSTFRPTRGNFGETKV